MNEPVSEVAVVLLAHGSSLESANQSVHALARLVESQGPYHYVRAAFLDPVTPTLAQAAAEAVEAGFSRVVIIPYFLTLGLHMQRDLPRLVEAERERFPRVEFSVGQSLDDHPLLASIVVGRIREATEEARVER